MGLKSVPYTLEILKTYKNTYFCFKYQANKSIVIMPYGVTTERRLHAGCPR